MATDGSTSPAASDDPATTEPNAPIEVVRSGELMVVVARGDIDAVAAPALREAVADVIDRGPGTVRIDMSAVDFLDSVGISALVASFNRAEDAGVRFELSAVPPSSLRVLEITRLTDVLTILD